MTIEDVVSMAVEEDPDITPELLVLAIEQAIALGNIEREPADDATRPAS